MSYHNIISAKPTNQNVVETSGFGSNQFDILSIGKGVVSADSNNANTSSTAINRRCCLAPRRNVANSNVDLTNSNDSSDDDFNDNDSNNNDSSDEGY